MLSEHFGVLMDYFLDRKRDAKILCSEQGQVDTMSHNP